MARSKVDLANGALRYLVRDTIQDLDGKRPEHIHTKANMDLAIETVIEAWDWQQCRVVANLTSVSVDSRGWSHAYAMPPDAVKIWRVYGTRFDKLEKWESGMTENLSSSTTYIYTNVASAKVRYGSNRVDIARFSPFVFELMSIKLAEFCCMPLVKDAKLLQFLQNHYARKLSEAKTAAANTEPEVVDPEFIPETIQVRSS